jgi:lipopolysaccharide heptosyltransferase II
LYIGVMTVERTRGVFEDNPYVDEIIIFDERTTHKKIGEKFKFISLLKRKRFDTAFLIHRSFTRAFICWVAGIGERIGYKRFKNTFVLTRKINPAKGLIHRQDKYLAVFKARGISFNSKEPQIFITENIRKQALSTIQTLSGDRSLVIGIHVGANWKLKRWRPEFFAQLADRLMLELGAAVIFTGSKKDSALVATVLTSMHQKPHNICGRTSLKGLSGLMEQMSLFISNDSGPAHLSAAVGAPTLVLFGPTSEALTGPRGKRVVYLRKHDDCDIPCYKANCKDNRCMDAISVEDVYLAASKLLVYEKYTD